MDIWFTSDTHFGHAAMAQTGKGWRPFATVEEHDAFLIESWNAVVKPGDEVWHLGDVSMHRNPADLWDAVSRLNGVKHLITGNHDAVWPGHRNGYKHHDEWSVHFASVQQYARRRIGKGENYVLSHFPYEGDHHGDVDRYREFRLQDNGLTIVHGHVHDEWAMQLSPFGTPQINVGVDVRDWRPVNLDELRVFMGEAREAAAAHTEQVATWLKENS